MTGDDIGVTWHACDVAGCEYRAKQAGGLKQHKACAHDIGAQEVCWLD